MNNTNKEEYVSRLKKTYSTLSQATNLIIAEEGTPRADKGGWANSIDNIYNLYRKHLVNAKECGSDTGCFSQLNKTNYKYLNGDNYTLNWDTQDFKKLILADGTQIMIETKHDTCNGSFNGSTDYCAPIWVDINGEKKPNIIGRDVFIFVLKEKGLYPAGCDKEDAICETTSNGKACTCRVLREGAMNY